MVGGNFAFQQKKSQDTNKAYILQTEFIVIVYTESSLYYFNHINYFP